MDILIGILITLAILGILASGVWVAITLIVAAALVLATWPSVEIGQVLATTAWSASSSYALTSLPLFIWMGEILTRSRLSEDLFSGLAPWMRRLPGGLAHVNIAGSGIFAAVSGSSAATCATVGRMALPELFRRGYDPKLAMGTLAGSSTLGLMIPPSLIMIVYGVATEQSIARLFIAGVLPGILLIALFMTYVGLWAILHPDKMPPPDPAMSLKQRLWQSRRLIPVVLLIMAIIGSIYGGIASPTDAAAVGVLLSLVISAASGTLTWPVFVKSLVSATRTSCMIAFIVAGAAFLSAAMGFIGLPRDLALWIGQFGLSAFSLIAVLTIFYILLGCILDGVSLVMLTTAVVLPMVQAVGLDPIWFGIYLVLVVEMGQITPPVGFNLFVISGLTGRNIWEIALASFPFFLLMLLEAALLVAFPEIATWLPQKMMGV